MGVRVLKPGMSTTIQDRGRYGYYSVGIPPSGSLDQFSAFAANLLVGNVEEAAVLECTYLGPQLLFETPCVVAVTGGGPASVSKQSSATPLGELRGGRG